MDTTTLSILVLVAIIYFLFFIGVVIFIINKRKGTFKQTVDPKPQVHLNDELEKK